MTNLDLHARIDQLTERLAALKLLLTASDENGGLRGDAERAIQDVLMTLADSQRELAMTDHFIHIAGVILIALDR